VLRQRLRAPDAELQLQRLLDEQTQIHNLVVQGRVPASRAAELAQSFVVLDDMASGVVTLTNQQIDADVGALQTGTDKAQRELFLESTLLVPLVLIVVLLFALRLSRPLRQIDRAIGELGRGNFSNGRGGGRSGGPGAARTPAGVAAEPITRTGARAQSVSAAHVARIKDPPC
jgi:hypothetical protein